MIFLAVLGDIYSHFIHLSSAVSEAFRTTNLRETYLLRDQTHRYRIWMYTEEWRYQGCTYNGLERTVVR